MYKISTAYSDWMAGNDWNVFGTLKFTDGTAIGKETADKLVRRFWNTMDRTYYGRLVETKGVRIKRATFLQFGDSGSNRHFHFIADVDFAAQFCVIAQDIWGDLDNWCDRQRSWIAQARDAEACARYAARDCIYDNWRDESSLQEQLTHLHNYGFDRARLRNTTERRLRQHAARVAVQR